MLDMTQRKEQPMNTPQLHSDLRLEETNEALAAAHDGPISAALESVRWERRGFLGRLRRDTAD